MMLKPYQACSRPCTHRRQQGGPLVCGRSNRPRRVTVQNAFSLSGMIRKSGASAGPANAAAVEVPAAAQNTVHPRKAVQAVPLNDRPSVELAMALAYLASHTSGPLATQLSEHELQLVTTSATCDAMFASALDSYSEDFEASGDGMAMPIADIRAAAEKMAAEVRGSFASDWNPSKSPGSSSFSSTSTNYAKQPGYHTLEQLQAQSDYEHMMGSNSSSGGSSLKGEAGKMLARVQSLQTQIRSAAAKATAQRKQPGASSNTSPVSKTTGAASTTAKSAKRSHAVAVSTTDDDYYGDAGAMPVVPRVGSGALSRFGAAGSSMSALKKAAERSYPVYTDPASTWIVADSKDGRTRHIVIQASEGLVAAVSGTRASSDLTTFENYSMGAKINKRLYAEANALYNRFMPLLLDHFEEAGPAAKVALSGAGVGGSLAAVLLLMFVARGVQSGVFAPVYTLNAPAVLCEVPDFKQWCSKDGCSMQDMDGMLEDLLHRGILSQLGLPQDAVRNIYHQQAAAEAAVQAVNPLGPLQAVAANSSKQLSKAVHYLDVTALQQSPLVPEVLKSWLRASEAGAGPNAMNSYQRLHILNPVGKMMLYLGGSGTRR